MPAEPVVIDANIGVFFAWPTDFSDITHRLIQTFLDTGRYIVVPELWNAEVVSALRKWGLHVQASTSEVRQAVKLALSLPAEVAPLGLSLCLDALTWAERLGERVVYDAFYLALAERLGAEFWTADERLYRKSIDQGATFVRSLLSAMI